MALERTPTPTAVLVISVLIAINVALYSVVGLLVWSIRRLTMISMKN